MIKETIVIDNRTLYKTYHDKYKIKKVGTNEVYDEAIDVNPTEYELTDIERTLGYDYSTGVKREDKEEYYRQEVAPETEMGEGNNGKID